MTCDITALRHDQVIYRYSKFSGLPKRPNDAPFSIILGSVSRVARKLNVYGDVACHRKGYSLGKWR